MDVRAMTPEWFQKVVDAEIHKEVVRAIDTEVEAAKERVEREIRGAADKIALSVLSHYDLFNRQDELVIMVRKDKPTEGDGHD